MTFYETTAPNTMVSRDGQKKQKVHVSIQRVEKFPISFDLPSRLLMNFRHF